MRCPLLVPLALSAAHFTAPVLAQQVYVVGTDAAPGIDFTNVQQAIDAAASGDALLFKAGTYVGGGAVPAFSITNKSLTLIADDDALAGKLTIQQLALGKQVALRGIDVDSPEVALLLLDNDGATWIEDGSFRSAKASSVFTPACVLANECAATTFARCSLGAATLPTTGTAASGLHAISSRSSAFSCELVGALGGPSPSFGDGGDGASIQGGAFYASACVLSGSNGANGVTLPIGFNAGAGGHGLYVFRGPTSAATLGCSFESGSGSAAQAPSADGQDGELIKVEFQGSHAPLHGVAHAFSMTPTPRVGEPIEMTCTGTPGEIVVRVLGFAQGYAYLSELRGVLVLSAPSMAVVLSGAL